jgi:hypothetical protein
MHGTHALQKATHLPSRSSSTPDGPFIAVFTSEEAAEWAAEQMADPKPAIACMPAEALFRMANNIKSCVRINHGLSRAFTMMPERVQDLVDGKFRHHQPSESFR